MPDDIEFPVGEELPGTAAPPDIPSSDRQGRTMSEATHVVRRGLPSVEITRFAEEERADLVVLGRKHRTAHERRMKGDTADAVTRRSHVPCLLVPGDCRDIGRAVVALDGTDRGFLVYREARDFARALRLELLPVTVERTWPGEPEHADGVLDARTVRLLELLRETDSLRARWRPEPLKVVRGLPVYEIGRVLDESEADLLILGYHRGGPAGVLEGTSVARRLVHGVSTAVLTIPL
jgi:nucleotide-binding universal stress UspA family protein